MLLGLVVILEVLYFTVAGRNFATPDNAANIVRHSVEIGLLALVMMPIILTGGIDLSVGSLLALGAVVFGKLWRDAGLAWPMAAAGTMLLGAAGGALNGTLITALRLPPLIATLATYSLYRGLAEAITRGTDAFTGFPESFLFLGTGHLGILPAQAWMLVAALLLVWIGVHRTTLGRSFRAMGFAPEGAVYAAIPVKRDLMLLYASAGLVAAIAALTYTARFGTAKADAGTGYELAAITAVVLGGTSIFGGVGSVPGTLLGVAAIAILSNGLSRLPASMSLASELAGLLTGVLLLVALGLSRLPRFGTLRVRRFSTQTGLHSDQP
jgi:rhamnose transport system permease protein